MLLAHSLGGARPGPADARTPAGMRHQRQDVVNGAARENGTGEIPRGIGGSPGDLQSALGAIGSTAIRVGRAARGFWSAVLDTGRRES